MPRQAPRTMWRLVCRGENAYFSKNAAGALRNLRVLTLFAVFTVSDASSAALSVGVRWTFRRRYRPALARRSAESGKIAPLCAVAGSSAALSLPRLLPFPISIPVHLRLMSQSAASAPHSPLPLFDQVRFVLNETSHPGNVGSAARAIKTMGFGRLVLAAPRAGADVLRDPEAIALASGADDVLANTLIVPDLVTALQGVNWAVALSARSREYGPPNAEPRESAAIAVQHAGQAEAVAFVFGSERTGLSNADVDRCNALVHIPANPVYSSLNLSQAVQLIAWEMRMACLAQARGDAPQVVTVATPVTDAASHDALATRDDVEGMLTHLERALVELDFLDPDNPKKLMTRLRRLFAKSHLEREEVNILRGISKHILERKVRR